MDTISSAVDWTPIDSLPIVSNDSGSALHAVAISHLDYIAMDRKVS